MKRVKIPISRDVIDKDYNVRIRGKSVEDVKELRNCKSLAELFMVLSELYAYVVYRPKGLSDKQTQEGYYRRELAMAKDIRFDYVNREIFIPLCRYKYNLVNDEAKEVFRFKNLSQLGFAINDKEYVQYERFYDKYTIWDKDGYRKSTVDIILGNEQNNLRYIRLYIGNLPIYSNMNKTEDVSELYNRYLKCCYRGGRTNSLDTYFYTIDRITSLRSKHRNVLKNLSLTWYGESCSEMFSRGFRLYNYEDIQGKFDDEELGINKMYEVCRIDFEAYLLSKLHNNNYWYGWDNGYTFNELLNGKIFFLKYSNKVPLVLLRDVIIK